MQGKTNEFKRREAGNLSFRQPTAPVAGKALLSSSPRNTGLK
jgi:hypothetical protein